MVGLLTVTVLVELTPLAVAVIVVVPAAFAVTRPDEDTVAIFELDVFQVTVLPDGPVVAVSCLVSPIMRVGAVGDTEIVGLLTVTVHRVLTPLAVAVIVAVPIPFAVTRPEVDTVAILESDDVQVTEEPDGVVVAVSCLVLPVVPK